MENHEVVSALGKLGIASAVQVFGEAQQEDQAKPWENSLMDSVEHRGEAIVTIGPLPPAEMDKLMHKVQQVAEAVGSEHRIVHTRTAGDTFQELTRTVQVRRQHSLDYHLNLRVAVVGNVDAGKSTLVGVLTGPTSFLDDGRGLARSRVLRHKHEAETGRTSSIAEDQHMRLSSRGDCLALEKHAKMIPNSAQPAKVVSFTDLAGHERYLRTTVYGLTAHEPDYVMVVVGSNHGITRMTKEHVGMAMALKVPIFVVITKTDLCPEPVMEETMKQLFRLLKMAGARKQPYVVDSMDDLVHAVRAFGRSAIAPIFRVSCVDGTNMLLLREFFNLIPLRCVWANKIDEPPEFLIDQFFNVPGVGIVVAGTLLSGTVSINSSMLIGPCKQGTFNAVTVKSIHHMRVAVPRLLAGQTGAFVVRSRTKEHVKNFGIRKGMILLSPSSEAVAAQAFECDVLVLHSQTTMKLNYQPVVYARNVRQSVRIRRMDKDVLRTGTRARVAFEFLYRPEFLRIGTKVLFTEGRTKAIGIIRSLEESR